MMITNKEQDDFMDDLLVRHLLGEAGREESMTVERWLAESAAHKKHYRQLQQVWEESAKLGIESPSEEAAWKRFQQHVKQGEEGKVKRLYPNRSRWMAIAASLTVLIGCTLWFVIQFRPFSGEVELVASNKVLTQTLPDQTIVTLNEHSSLSYPKKFKDQKRVVTLQGEAYFKVSHREQQPFVVKVDGLTITDIGTTFNINENKNFTEIIVTDGVVKVSTGSKSVILKAGEKIRVSKEKGLLSKQKVNNQLFNYYRTKAFICDNTPLIELVNMLSQAYDTDIVITSPELKQLPITTTFHRSQSLDSILQIITQTFQQVKLSKKGEKFILSKK